MGIAREDKWHGMYDNILKEDRLGLSESEAKEWKAGILATWLSLNAQSDGVAERECYHAAEQNAHLYSTGPGQDSFLHAPNYGS